MVAEERTETPGPGEVVVEVAGCGICHTDLGFYYDGVPTRKALPLTLGHEISGTVVEAGAGAESWLRKVVVVPAVIPCGKCPACQSGHGSICPTQIFPGNDVHGGFATHVRVPAQGLCPVPDLQDKKVNPAGVDLASLAVLADAVTTPFQAIHRSGLRSGDLAIVVGAGGVGGYAVQIAAAKGAEVIALDIDAGRLQMAEQHGAALGLRADQLDFKAIKGAVRGFAKEHGGHLSVVGFTAKKLELRLSNLMVFDATARGNWGCLPELYPPALQLVLEGKVALLPFTEKRPLASINQSFADVHDHKVARRIVLVPEA